MKKVCWISEHMDTPELFLNNIIKMTPGKKGIWKDMVATTNPKEADFIFVMDGCKTELPWERTIIFSEHPQCLAHYRNYEDMKGKALLCLPLHKFVNPGEWWISHDYDFLSSLQPPKKTRNNICIFTAKTNHKMYTDRIKFMTSILPKYSNIDMFGRPEQNFNRNPILKQYYKGVTGKIMPNGRIGEHQLGKDVLIDYRYSFEFDNGPTFNYFSERFYDAMLLWCMPIYWGSNNVHDYIPVNSFKYVDIETDEPKEVNDIISLLSSNFREDHLDDIKQARELLLNKYQLWAYMYDVINNLDTYISKWMSK